MKYHLNKKYILYLHLGHPDISTAKEWEESLKLSNILHISWEYIFVSNFVNFVHNMLIHRTLI